jgi:phage anti-repressor protein
LDDDYSVLCRNANNGFGGRNKETIMISFDTFEAVSFLSLTEKGKQTSRYLSKMKWVMKKSLMKQYHDTVMLFNLTEKHSKTSKTMEPTGTTGMTFWDKLYIETNDEINTILSSPDLDTDTKLRMALNARTKLEDAIQSIDVKWESLISMFFSKEPIKNFENHSNVSESA